MKHKDHLRYSAERLVRLFEDPAVVRVFWAR